MRFAYDLSLIDPRGEAGQGTPVPNNQRGFLGLSAANDPATVDVSSFFSAPATGQVSFTGVIGPTVSGNFFIILVPETFVVLQIFDPNIPFINELPGYTVTQDVRQIGGINFDSYVIGPTNPDLSITRTVSTAAP